MKILSAFLLQNTKKSNILRDSRMCLCSTCMNIDLFDRLTTDCSFYSSFLFLYSEISHSILVELRALRQSYKSPCFHLGKAAHGKHNLQSDPSPSQQPAVFDHTSTAPLIGMAGLIYVGEVRRQVACLFSCLCIEC